MIVHLTPHFINVVEDEHPYNHGFVANHLFVFTPKVSHYHAFDKRRPNHLNGLD